MADVLGGQRDLASLVVPRVGAVVAFDYVWEPVRLLDASGAAVGAVGAFLQDLQAAGRSAATQRSYAMDLLRWFRFGWAVEGAVGSRDSGRGPRLLPFAVVAG